MPGIEKSIDFDRIWSRHQQKAVIKPDHANIVKTAIMPGIDEILDLDRIWSRHRRKAILEPGPGNEVEQLLW